MPWLANYRTFALLTVIWVMAGCVFDPRVPGTPGDGGPGADAMDCDEHFISFTPSNFDKCALSTPTQTLDLSGANSGTWVYDTFSDVLVGPGPLNLVSEPPVPQSSGPFLRIIVVDGVFISTDSIFRVTGSYPLVIVSSGDIVINGQLAAAGQADGSPGPGGGLTDFCTGGNGAAGVSQMDAQGESAGSGGGGAGFGGAGGSGAAVGGLSNEPTTGGTAAGNVELIPLRGGCTGGRGGGGVGDAGGGRGGAAGGAIQLVSATAVRINASAQPPGSVTARGSGGRGGTMNTLGTPSAGGGGGGGSGGAILIEAKEIHVQGLLVATGGGGGEGANANANGTVGSETSGREAYAAPGGGDGAMHSGGNGGRGGGRNQSLTALLEAENGQSGTGPDTTDAIDGGGGGGGGYGRIRLNAYGALDLDGGAISPSADTTNTTE